MDICQLVYISERANVLGDEELFNIMLTSHVRNESLGISGLLLSSGSHFIQVLEGDWLRVGSLYRKISADRRHRNVQCLLEKSVSGRLFPDWGMKLADTRRAAALDRQRIDKTLIRMRLANREEQSQAAIALLSEFKMQLMSEAA